LCVNQELAASELLGQLQRGDECSSASASYGFWFPERFSPLGYFWGISVNPHRRYGTWAAGAARRLSNWRDNTRIGLSSVGTRRYFSAGEGFVRDVYPLMLLSATHLARSAGGVSLRQEIEQDELGELEPAGGKLLWQVPPSKLIAAQSVLDERDITLSGRRLEHLAATPGRH
jgi:hypothetical protein